jgi:hypothetical protein
MPCCSSNVSGALTELAAISSMGAYLVIQPEITFWRQMYRRHTNFARAEQCVGFCSSVGFDKKLRATIPRSGDLIWNTYFEPRLTALRLPAQQQATDYVYWVNAVGQVMIDEASLTIGGAQVDKFDSNYLFIWEELSRQAGKNQGEAIGKFDNIEDQRDFAFYDQTLYTKLPFFFSGPSTTSISSSACNALALIALQYHDVCIELCIRKRENLIVAHDDANPPVVIPLSQVTGGDMEDANLLIDYVFLDTCERSQMASQAHEFLISQVQMSCCESVVAGSTRKSIPLHFNHPTTELFVVYSEDYKRQAPVNRFTDYSIDAEVPFPWAAAGPLPKVDPLDTLELKFNGHDRISAREAKYFRLIQPYQFHSSLPSGYIYNYCFSIAPEDDVQPHGAADLSRIDNVVLCLEFAKKANGSSLLINDGIVCTYARSMNVAKMAGGMFATKYSN